MQSNIEQSPELNGGGRVLFRTGLSRKNRGPTLWLRTLPAAAQAESENPTLECLNPHVSVHWDAPGAGQATEPKFCSRDQFNIAKGMVKSYLHDQALLKTDIGSQKSRESRKIDTP